MIGADRKSLATRITLSFLARSIGYQYNSRVHSRQSIFRSHFYKSITQSPLRCLTPGPEYAIMPCLPPYPDLLIEKSESVERAVHERPHMFPQSKSLSPDNICPPQTTLSHPRKSYSPQQNNRILRCLRPFASKHLVSLYHPFDPSPVGLNTRVTYAYLHLSFSIPHPISHSPHTQILRSHHTVPLSGRCSTSFSGGSGPIGESLGRYVPPSAHS